MHPNQRILMQHIKFAMSQKDAPYKIFVPKGQLRDIHFSIRGPKNSIFEGGLYHAMLRLSDQYPFVAPDMIFIQESGKFTTGGNICLSFRENPSLWSPSLGINGIIRSIQSLFDDREIHGTNIITTPSKETVEKLKEGCRGYQCDVCGCKHGEFYDEIQAVQDEFDK